MPVRKGRWAGRLCLIGAVLALALPAACPAAGQSVDRSKPPTPGPPPALRPPTIVRRTLSNGLPLLIVERHRVPLAAVTLLVRSGSTADPPAKIGAASLTAAMLDEGAGGRSALAIADEIELLGASLSTSSTYDSSVVRLEVPVARLPVALPIAAAVALGPTFPQEELERLRQERLTAILQLRDNPAALAPLAFAHVVYGSHRYGLPAGGTEASLRGLTVTDLREFHAAHYRPDNAALIVIGDVTADSMVPLLESAFGRWSSSGQIPSPSLPSVSRGDDRRIHLLDVPGAAQSQIRIGTVGVSRSTPDYFAITVLNTILGGSFSSRLNQNLREEHGYTYGAFSAFEMRRSAGPFFAAAGVQTDKTAEALKEFFNELNGILAPIPRAELERVKNLIALGFPAEFETVQDLSRQLEEVLLYDLPSDYLSTYVERIRAVRAEDVQRAGRRYIDPTNLAIVIVGDARVIRDSIEALKLGPIRPLSLTEVLGTVSQEK